MDKLKALRQAMATHKLAAYLQPVHDEYLNEYPPACNRRAEWLTGFSGSAGTVVVLAKKAALFVDGRYTLQAKNEINARLFDQFNSGEETPEAWLARHVASGDRIGYDPRLYTKRMLTRMQSVLDAKNIKWIPAKNLIDTVWEDRPPAPASPVFIHDIQYAGEESRAKRRRMAKHINAAGADACIIAAPDAICWLLNIRAADVVGTPLVLATAILDTNARVKLYLAPDRCDSKVRNHLGGEVELCDPTKLEVGLQAFSKKSVLCDPQTVPLWFTDILEKAGARIVEAENPCILAKATKNSTELQGMRNAHIRDGVAVTKLLCWLDNEISQRRVMELEVSDMLLKFRAAHPMFVEPSFPTIAGSGRHGAIVHYRASESSNRLLAKGELFLLDSGGQYPDGTTDITRTVPIGQPTPEQVDRFTRVLKGHIALALARFPEGTTGSQLDALARQYLWQAGLDYDHGTGHGVGCFLGVHEGPQRISKRGGDAALLPGMIVSNEPGYYQTGDYGIRIESLVAVAKGEGKFLDFETLTCAPIDTRLVDKRMLTDVEKGWLNAYHGWVLSTLSPSLEERERQWLTVRCAAI